MSAKARSKSATFRCSADLQVGLVEDMIPAQFDYHRPGTLPEALALLKKHGDDARVLAGGHSLIPAMKLRLVEPRVIVDLGRIAELRGITEQDGWIAIGGMTTHAEIASSSLLSAKCPLLTEAAPHIGDLQVRNKGTIGGSLAHADPAADWPPVILALDAELEIAGSGGTRQVAASGFFTDLMQTALKPGEVLRAIRVRPSGPSVAYVKTEQKASGFALCGVAAVVDRATGRASVAITGVAATPYRAREVERALVGAPVSSDRIAAAAGFAAAGVQPLGDMHGSPEYRAHLAEVNTRRALERAVARTA
jgi:carbon-monoxide dehydrogenase medium subunit